MGRAAHTIEVIAFDLDGTLVDTSALHVAATRVAVRTIFGTEISDTLIAASLGRPLPESMAMVSAGRGQVNELAMAYMSYYAAHANDGAQCFPQTQTLLQQLHALGLRLALLSNKLRTWGRNEIERLGLMPFFGCVTFMEDMPSPKPSGLALHPILATMLVQPEQVLVVGDGTSDIACARAAGAHSGAALWGVSDAAMLLRAQPEFVFHQMDDLLTIFQA